MYTFMFGIETHHFYTSHLDGMDKIVKCRKLSIEILLEKCLWYRKSGFWYVIYMADCLLNVVFEQFNGFYSYLLFECVNVTCRYLTNVEISQKLWELHVKF